jgi:threonine/homoserine efflux transporter RhtA
MSSLRLTQPGVLSGLASGLASAMYTIFGKTALRRYGPLTTLTYSLGFGTFFLAVLALATGVVPGRIPSPGWTALAYLALVTTLLAQGLYLAGLRHIGAGPASLLAAVEPVAAAVLGYIVQGNNLKDCRCLVACWSSARLCSRGRRSCQRADREDEGDRGHRKQRGASHKRRAVPGGIPQHPAEQWT